MAKVINITIDCTKIDKAKLYNGKYLDITCFLNDAADDRGQFGMVVQSAKKDEPKGAILGNIKFLSDELKQKLIAPVKPQDPHEAAPIAAAYDDLPF